MPCAPSVSRKTWAFVIGAVLLMAAVGCAHQPTPTEIDPPGFLMGFVHGFLILFSLIGSIFKDVRIYAFPNSGGWYDFGFFLGAAFFLGGSGGVGVS